MVYQVKSIKLVIIGDSQVGKTCFFITEATGQYPTDYIPTVFESCPRPGLHYDVTHLSSDGKTYKLLHYDTACEPEYDRLRTLSYPQTDVCIICFSVSSPSSYENVSQKWIHEIKKHIPNAPIILLATKIDLRDDQNTIEFLKEMGHKPISYEQGLKLSNEIKANAYLEVSSLNKIGIKQVTNKVFKLSIKFNQNIKPNKSKCNIL